MGWEELVDDRGAGNVQEMERDCERECVGVCLRGWVRGGRTRGGVVIVNSTRSNPDLHGGSVVVNPNMSTADFQRD
jgi:hypothetical protein